MNQKQKNILIGLALVLLGALISYVVTSREYGAGPLAGLQSQSSEAMLGSPDCGALRNWATNVNTKDAWDTYNHFCRSQEGGGGSGGGQGGGTSNGRKH